MFLKIFASAFDLSSCFTSLRPPLQAWGTLWVLRGGAGVYDLGFLPFGWKLSAPLCRAVEGNHVHRAFDMTSCMPAAESVEYHHHLDDVLVVTEGPP